MLKELRGRGPTTDANASNNFDLDVSLVHRKAGWVHVNTPPLVRSRRPGLVSVIGVRLAFSSRPCTSRPASWARRRMRFLLTVRPSTYLRCAHKRPPIAPVGVLGFEDEEPLQQGRIAALSYLRGGRRLIRPTPGRFF